MTLKLYQKKRNFKKTSEPRGRVIKSKKPNNLYVIQKHAASHLHYDFRLELNGVLLSWAVPKGPSLDPSVKRLAMHVEDHPLEYGSFQGIIPKGQYGGGTVMLWDKGKWISEDAKPLEAYKKGNMKFQLKGKKLNGGWKLIRMNNNDKTWLLIKSKDDYALPAKKYDITLEKPNSVSTNESIEEISENYKKIWGKKGAEKKSTSSKPKKIKLTKIKIDLPARPFPKSISPELATLVDKPPLGNQWLHEIKFDGYRLLAFKKGKKVTLYTRNQHDWTDKFKKIAEEMRRIPVENMVCDGEVVALDENQHSNFQLLQNSIKENSTDFYYYLFDLIYYDKYDITSLKLLARKNILKQIILNQNSDTLRYSDHVIGSGENILESSCELGLEGIVSKNIDSPYSEVRNKNWLKTKCLKRQEFVIGGFTQSSRRKYFRSLMLGTFNKRLELIYNGNVGTGFTAASLKTIYSLLSKHITKKMPFTQQPPASKDAVWVKPVIVAEIEFTEWTNAGTLRHPSFKGIRADKPVKNVTREVETPVENIVSLSHPDKILYPEDKITKGEIAEYYNSIQQWILPYITNRPLTIVRCPNTYKQCFYQKHLTSSIPDGIHEIMIKEKMGKDKYIYIQDVTGLLALAQMGVLEMHPWGSQIKKLEYPDILVFDLDPAPEIPWKKVVKAAFEIKNILQNLKLTSFVKTTGGKGLHVVLPIKPEYDWNEIKIFSHSLVKYLVMNHSKDYIDVMTKSKRKNKIYVDYLRNQRGATSIAPYSTRARKKAPIATPLAWDELTNRFDDTFFTIKTLPARLDALKKDPWEDFFRIRQSLDLDKFR